jgi:hypothetical protein
MATEFGQSRENAIERRCFEIQAYAHETRG